MPPLGAGGGFRKFDPPGQPGDQPAATFFQPRTPFPLSASFFLFCSCPRAAGQLWISGFIVDFLIPNVSSTVDPPNKRIFQFGAKRRNFFWQSIFPLFRAPPPWSSPIFSGAQKRGVRKRLVAASGWGPSTHPPGSAPNHQVLYPQSPKSDPPPSPMRTPGRGS